MGKLRGSRSGGIWALAIKSVDTVFEAIMHCDSFVDFGAK